MDFGPAGALGDVRFFLPIHVASVVTIISGDAVDTEVKKDAELGITEPLRTLVGGLHGVPVWLDLGCFSLGGGRKKKRWCGQCNEAARVEKISIGHLIIIYGRLAQILQSRPETPS